MPSRGAQQIELAIPAVGEPPHKIQKIRLRVAVREVRVHEKHQGERIVCIDRGCDLGDDLCRRRKVLCGKPQVYVVESRERDGIVADRLPEIVEGRSQKIPKLPRTTMSRDASQ